LPAQLASGSASAESLSGRQNAEASCGAAQSNIASREPKLTEYRGHAVADIASKIVAATVSNDRTRAETETHEPNPGTVRPRRRWVWWVVVGVGVLGLVIGPIGIWLTVVWFGGLAQLESAMAEADAIYPHWRWEDLIRQREQVPPEENAWPLIEQIAERYLSESLHRNTREETAVLESLESISGIKSEPLFACRIVEGVRGLGCSRSNFAAPYRASESSPARAGSLAILGRKSDAPLPNFYRIRVVA
jgi:hypothetical protein